jgi:integrase
MILIGYRHGLRASELCDLQWIELATGRVPVRRAKNGSPSVPEGIHATCLLKRVIIPPLHE